METTCPVFPRLYFLVSNSLTYRLSVLSWGREGEKADVSWSVGRDMLQRKADHPLPQSGNLCFTMKPISPPGKPQHCKVQLFIGSHPPPPILSLHAHTYAHANTCLWFLFSSIGFDSVSVCHIIFCPNTQQMVTFVLFFFPFFFPVTTRLRVWRCPIERLGAHTVRPDTCSSVWKMCAVLKLPVN